MNKKYLLIAGCILMVLVSLTVVLLMIFLPNNKYIQLYDNTQYKLILDGELRNDVLEQNGEKYFSYDIVKDGIDKYIWLDKEAGVITVITGAEMLSLNVNEDENIKVQNDKIFIKESYIEEIYNIRFSFEEENNITVITNIEMYYGEVVSLRENLDIRRAPSIKEPKVRTEIGKNGQVIGKALDDGTSEWVKVISLTGEIGYVKRKHIDFKENKDYTGIFKGINTELPGSKDYTDYIKEELNGERLSMVWEAVYNKSPDVSLIEDMEGINVVAPTWFELSNEYGEIKNTADKDYVNWAHERNYYVWGTAVSLTDYEMTSKLLNNVQNRRKYIEKLIDYSEEYDLDGINVDFEYMYEEDKYIFTQFVRELSFLCHKNNIPLSCDVTILSNSPKWSLCYDRISLADSLDYICVMFYDQHSGGGGKSGSVAQLSWAEESLKDILEQIPKEKLIFGYPLYTRLWEEKTEDTGEIKVTSTVMYMEDTIMLIEDKKLEPKWDEISGQYFVQYEENNSVFKLWIEDESSIKKRIELVVKYDLAGCAAWRRGFEINDIWKVVDSELSK